ncbi:MAG: transcription antitermination factor NusB [Sedimentisphaerales bacterium]|jgi:16S rRNA (cytosine967-C5)-methyltransferase
MPEPKPIAARGIAAEVLTETRKDKQFAGDALDHYPKLDNRQKATDLVFGVIKNRLIIDLVIEKVSGIQIVHIPSKILNIIRVGVYEIIFCPRAKEYVIVCEAVEYAKHVTNTKGAGFVNAILRQVQKHIINRQKPADQSSLRKLIPQTPTTGCEFDIEMLPAPEETPCEYLACAFSLPGWLVRNWLDEYGREQTEKICFASNRRPSVYLRPNPLKTTAGELAEKLKAAEVDCDIESESQMIKLTSPKAVTALPGFDEGLFAVQDLSAAEVVRVLKPKPGWTILDLCAAPGTKTTQLAEATSGHAKIIAADIDSDRLKKVKENIARLGLSGSITTIEYSDIEKQSSFDCVLVDVPCSNTGVLARRPEVRHRITKDDVKKLAQTQMTLLSKAVGMLKPKGVICYSTCSIQPEEDGLLVRGFIKENPSFKIDSESLILPSADKFDRDGSYVAVIVGG